MVAFEAFPFFFFVPVSRWTETAPAASLSRRAASAAKNRASASSSSSESSICSRVEQRKSALDYLDDERASVQLTN